MNAQDEKQVEVIAAAKVIGEGLIIIGETFKSLGKSLDVLLSITDVCLMPEKAAGPKVEPDNKPVTVDVPKNVEEAQPIEKVEPVKQPDQPKVDFSEIRTLCVKLSKEGLKKEVAEVIQQHGHAKQLSGVDEQYYPALLDAVKALQVRA